MKLISLLFYRYACPLCFKSVCDMSKVWEKLDMEVAATPMPEFYQKKLVCYLSVSLFSAHWYWKVWNSDLYVLFFVSWRFGSCATTVEPILRWHFILSLINVPLASLTTHAKLEAEFGWCFGFCEALYS